MSQRIYISADYDEDSGDREVVEELNKWGTDNLHKIDFVDMAKVVSGSVSKNPDCRICDLKEEFNRQINASSAVIIVVGNKTKLRTAGDQCERVRKQQSECCCTPYKANANGMKVCKVTSVCKAGPNDDYGNINSKSYLQHEFQQAKKKKKAIIVVYNSTRNESSWLPQYMNGYEDDAFPFWIKDANGERLGNYAPLKKALGYD